MISPRVLVEIFRVGTAPDVIKSFQSKAFKHSSYNYTRVLLKFAWGPYFDR